MISREQFNHDQRYEFFERVIERVSALPGVQSASAAWPLPMSAGHASISFNIAGGP